MKRLLGATVVTLFTLSGCGGDETDVPQPSEVDWSQYDAAVQERVRQGIRQENCGSLQAEFDRVADGKGGADLLEFIDDSMKYLDC